MAGVTQATVPTEALVVDDPSEAIRPPPPAEAVVTTRRWWAVWACWFALGILVALAPTAPAATCVVDRVEGAWAVLEYSSDVDDPIYMDVPADDLTEGSVVPCSPPKEES